MLISSIQYLPVLTQILTTASPRGGWQIFNMYYQLKAAAEKSKLTQQYHRFRSEANQTPQSYFGRFAVLRSRLASHDTIFSDIDAQYQLVRNFSPTFSMQKSIILTHSDLAMQVVKEVVTSAYEEMEIEQDEEARNGTGHAFFTSGTGRGGVEVTKMGDGKIAAGGSGRRQERDQQGNRKFCTHYNIYGHDISECRDRFKHQLPPQQQQQPQSQPQHH